MIDWAEFVDSLDTVNFDTLTEAVRLRRMDIAEGIAAGIVLSFPEVKTARENKLAAVKLVNSRLDCGIIIAKLAVELMLDNERDEAASREDGGDGPEEDTEETVIGYEHIGVD